MRRITSVLVTLFLAALSVYAAAKGAERGRDGRYGLAALWKEYARAEAGDRPEKQTEILKEIMARSRSGRLSRDYYDSWAKFVNVSSSRNWKLRDSLVKECTAALEDYGEPILTYLWKSDRRILKDTERLDFIRENALRLKAACNTEIHRAYPPASVPGGSPGDFIRNDYEYCLWMYLGGWKPDAEAFRLMREEVGGTYPGGAFLDYLEADGQTEREARIGALGEVASENRGNAVGMMAEGRLLGMEMSGLEEEEASSESFRTFHGKVMDFEKRRKTLRGADARLMKGYDSVRRLADRLESQEIVIEGGPGDELVIMLRNLDGVRLSVYRDGEKEKILSRSIGNPHRTFYVPDTVRFRLPPLDDGSYRAEAVSGKSGTEVRLEHYSLSLAGRRDSRDYRIYLAEGGSGKPVEKADLILSRNGKEIAAVRDFRFGEGFSPVPREIAEALAHAGVCQLECSFRGDDGLLRKSRGIYVSDDGESVNAYREVIPVRGMVFTDRKAYRPGESVHVNALFCEEDAAGPVRAYGDGAAVRLQVFDSGNRELFSEDMVLNDFGSAHTSFAIPEGLRNGMFRISAATPEGYAAGTYIQVDDFVLPESFVEFEKPEHFIPGDTVIVRGRLNTYSGHSAASAALSYQVSYRGEVIRSGPLAQEADGSFSVEFPTGDRDEWQFYRLAVKTVDGNGQTLEYNAGITVERSFGLELNLRNNVEGRYGKAGERWTYAAFQVLDSDTAVIGMSARGAEDTVLPAEISYTLLGDKGEVLLRGSCPSGGAEAIDLSSFRGNLFTLKAEASYRGYSAESRLEFARVREESSCLDSPLRYFFRPLGPEIEAGQDMMFQFGASDGDVWAVIEVFGDNRTLLHSSVLHLDGAAGDSGSLRTLSLEYPETYPDAVLVKIFFFRDGGETGIGSEFRRVRRELELPLEWSRFEDRSSPGETVTVGVKTLPDTEIMASVYDRSMDRISPNLWPVLGRRWPVTAGVSVSSRHGDGWTVSRTYGTVLRKAKAAGTFSARNALYAADDMIEEAAYDSAEASVETAGSLASVSYGGDGEEPRIREDFAGTLAFEPALRSDGNGFAEFSFVSGDRLSTFKVMIFAHDRTMRNAVLVRDMLVSIPVRLNIVPPSVLRVGDVPELSVTVSSDAEKEITGTLSLYRYAGNVHEGAEAEAVFTKEVRIGAFSSGAFSFSPGVFTEEGEAGFRIEFRSEDFSDAVFVTVPVESARQRISESHSAVLLPGDDRRSVSEKLRASFVNTGAYGAEVKEIGIRDMVKDCIEGYVAGAPDVLSLCNALFALETAGELGIKAEIRKPDGSLCTEEGLASEISACRNADGGWSWFQGMESSPAITMKMLDNLGRMTVPGVGEAEISAAVHYMDKAFFSGRKALWRGGISMEDYLLVRSAYARVPFVWKAAGEEEKERFASFGKDAEEYLVPGEKRGLNGRIYSKALRLETLAQLADENGKDLCKAWNLKHSSLNKVRASLEADVLSLLEYAVPHRDGGMYYPDAVMPFRGMTENEAHAHSLICGLLREYAASGGASAERAESVARGIRIWLMLQKETQKWDEGPGFIEALSCILKGGAPDVRIIVMSKSYEKDCSGIAAAGNGFRLEKVYLRDGAVLKEGDRLNVGDRIRAEYRVWSGENRSFVRLRAFREGCLSPVDQISGNMAGSPYRRSGRRTGSGMGYRNVRRGETEYYFESLPEEDSVIAEEFYVTQAGTFGSPVCEVECLYAPHYRANASCGKALGSLNPDRTR